MNWEPEQSDPKGDCRFLRMSVKCLLAENVVSIRSDTYCSVPGVLVT
jgi:hypothetical protein